MPNANKLDLDRFPYRLFGPALAPAATTLESIETMLTERAESLGVTIIRDHGVTKIAAQDDTSVTVDAKGNQGQSQSYRGKWLVGSDGGRSLVRKAAGFDFAGTEAKFTGYAVKCDFEDPSKLKPGFHATKTGMYIVAPSSLYLVDFDGATFDRHRRSRKSTSKMS
jgi:2-polyprenyl-6-methoxyphenol hydroxylase-like FAD-dependent oxidoreductase